ncbi:MAG: ferritin-like domain-containing protein [Neisseriaceae bacterium]|nr:ferritin-like domain-containing protein [Neisseriaceae bacterium]
MQTNSSLFQQVETALLMTNPSQKTQAVHTLYAQWQQHLLQKKTEDCPSYPLEKAGLPHRLQFNDAGKMPKRRMSMPEGRAIMLHAIAHIEFNAINLALDAVWRFREMPDAFISDWLRVAAEEANHFDMLAQRLANLGYEYGDFPAHASLWEMAVRTDFDVLVRMALVPRVMEARGLDVTPAIIEKFRHVQDFETVAVLQVIYNEEVGHVAIGNFWFKTLCQQRGFESEPTFIQLVRTHGQKILKLPFNQLARTQAGFSDFELSMLNSLALGN